MMISMYSASQGEHSGRKRDRDERKMIISMYSASQGEHSGRQRET